MRFSKEVFSKVQGFWWIVPRAKTIHPLSHLRMERRAKKYLVEALSVEGFIQQIAVSYLANGYFFFVSGFVPKDKQATAIDAKLLDRYGVGVSKWSRARQKRSGIASMQYIRYGRLFLLMATHGKHTFFTEEKKGIRDARRTPIKAFGYAISFRGGHSHVRIELSEYKRLKAHLIELGKHRVAETVEAAFRSVPFEPYAPVRRQLINIWRAVNRARKEAGFDLISIECIRMKRRIVKPFGELASE